MNSSAICPFTFSDPPMLPSIDRYMNTNQMKSLVSPKHNKKKPHKLPTLDKPRIRKGSVWGGRTVVNGFSKSDIDLVLDYIKSFADCEEGISLNAFIESFRKHSVAGKNASHDEIARRLLITFDLFLQLSNQGLSSWFHSNANGDTDKMTVFKFQYGLKRLAERCNQSHCWTSSELQMLTHYIAPHGRPEISQKEIEKAFASLKHADEDDETKERLDTLLDFLKKCVDKEKLRVSDLFCNIDVNKTGVVSLEAIRTAIKSLILSPDKITKRKRLDTRASDLNPLFPVPKVAETPWAPKGSGAVTLRVGFATEDENSSEDGVDLLSVGSRQQRPVPRRRVVKNREEAEFVKLMKESQQFLSTKDTSFDKTSVAYQARVKKDLEKYLANMKIYDKKIEADLHTLGNNR